MSADAGRELSRLEHELGRLADEIARAPERGPELERAVIASEEARKAADAEVERIVRDFLGLRQQEHAPAFEAAPGARGRPVDIRVVAQQAARIGVEQVVPLVLRNRGHEFL
ncbi:hypothetical protein LTR94_035419, partial [Friedmanniomyces endolithicus]